MFLKITIIQYAQKYRILINIAHGEYMKKKACSIVRRVSKRKKNGIIVLILIVISTLIISTSNNLFKSFYGFYSESLDKKPIISAGEEYSGLYEGGANTMGMKWEENYTDSWSDTNNTTILNSHNASYGGFEYSLNRLDIRAYNIYKGEGTINVANDTSKFSTIPNGYKIAQTFTTPSTSELLSIDVIELYITHILFSINTYFYLVWLLDEHMEDILGGAVQEAKRGFFSDWVAFNISSNILEQNKNYTILYYMLEKSEVSDLKEYQVNTWFAENKTVPDIGLTMKFNGIDYVPIHNDSYRDMLCKMTYKEIINPEKVNMKFVIDNQTITPIYQKSLWTGALGYEGYLIYNLGNHSIYDVNVTIITNQTIPNLEIHIRRYYVFTIDTSGYYNVSGSTIEWTMSYDYYDIGAYGIELWFLYETDWELQHFFNTLGSEMLEVYFGPVKLYNISYYGLFDIWGTPLEPGTCVGKYQSPNYCDEINTKVKSGDEFQEKGIFQLGQTIKLEAKIRNSLDETISGGLGRITFKNPSGAIIYQQENITSFNGIINSSEIVIEGDFVIGNYDVEIFWTDGKEIAVYSIQIEVTSLYSAFPIEIILLISIITGLSVIVIPSARKYIRQRNWEKSLRNLFVLSKEGVNMYNYTFGIEIQKPELISGMISALTTFMKEATGSQQELRTIDQEDKKVIIYTGTHSRVALVCDKDLPIIHKRVKRLSEEFEAKYGKRLVNWSGEISMFKDAEPIVMKYFPVSMEQKIIHGVRQKLINFREELQATSDPQKIVSLMHEITEFSSRYQEIITCHYMKYLGELIKIAEEKIRMQ